MTELLDPGLRARFDAALPAPVLDDAAVGSLLRRGRRRRRARQAGAGAATLGVLAALTVGGMALTDRSPAPPVAPPPDTTVGTDLWLSADRVPPGAEVVGVLLVGTGPGGEVFDQLASVERWEDGAWVDRAEPLLWCLPTDPCSAEVMAPGTAVDFQPVDIAPEPGVPGPAMRMSTAGLEPGWYRITHAARSGAVASAVVEIAADAQSAAPLVPLDEPSLAVDRPVIPADPTGPLVLTRVDPEGGSAAGEPADRARVDAWRDGAWVTVEDPVALSGDMDGAGAPVVQGVITLPLDRGEYRVVLSGPDGDVWGRFWVVESPQAELRSAPAEVLDMYSGLPDSELVDEARQGRADAASSLYVDGETVIVAFAGSGDCVPVPVGTELLGGTLTIVVRDAGTACAPDGTYTTYVLALPPDASRDPFLTVRDAASLEAPYPQLRLWLTDVVAETGFPLAPLPEDVSGRYAVAGVLPREAVTVVAELADEAELAAGIAVTGTAELDGVVLETGKDGSRAAAARFACGGLVLSFFGSDGSEEAAADVRLVAETVARGTQPCPAGADSIAVP